MPAELWNRLNSYLELIQPLSYAAWAFRVTAFEALRSRGLKALSGISQWRDQAFTLWYRTLNENFNRFEDTTAVPKLVSHASGTILELGPALGNQLPRFDKSIVGHIYGVEPNPFFKVDLETKIVESGLRGKYTLITCGVEDTDVLEMHGITTGSLETIVSIQVLCSVPQPEAVVKGLYQLLRPGGRFIFWEHHHSHDRVTKIVQSVWNPAWRCGIGCCNINRDMLKILSGAGEWKNFDAIEGDEGPWSMLPRIWGELEKPPVTG